MKRSSTRVRSHTLERATLPMGRALRLSLLLKDADAILEIVGGVLLLIVPPAFVGRLVVTLTQHELSEDPHDLIAAHLRDAVAHLAGARFFGAAYLLSLGVGKIVLVSEIFRGPLWAYPGMVVLLTSFIAYQTYRLALGFTVGMFALTMFDIAKAIFAI
jgi:uncharacterized membrane protein